MNAKTIISASNSFGKYNSNALNTLTTIGYKVTYDCWPTKTIPMDQVVGLVVSTQTVDSESLSMAKNLKIVAKYGIGVDSIDVLSATACGIYVAVAKDANSEAVAEMALSLLLSVTRNIPRADKTVRDGKWDRFIGHELHGKTVGIIGLGSVGRIFARRILSFDVHLMAYDPYWNDTFAKDYGIIRSEVDSIFEHADYISLHCPLTPETRGLVNRQRLGKMKPNAYLINTSRGQIVDEAALYDVLSQKRIAGAALDVFWEEPPVHSPLLMLDNVVVTSHMGAYTYESFARMDETTVYNLAMVLEGKMNDNIINARDIARTASVD